MPGTRSFPTSKLAVIGFAVVSLTSALGCGSDPSSGASSGTSVERTVCSRLQDMVTALGDDRSLDAVTAYDAMVAWANEADAADAEASSVLGPARRMASITDATVDESKLPMSQVAALARTAMVQSGDALAEVIDGCASIGEAIKGLDSAGKLR